LREGGKEGRKEERRKGGTEEVRETCSSFDRVSERFLVE